MDSQLELKETTKIYDEFQKGMAYLNDIGIARQIPKNVDYFEGRQWPAPTKNTKDLPRPVFNFIEMLVNNKASNILGSPVKLNFIADNDIVSTKNFTRFAQYQQKEMRQDEYDNLAILDSLIKGTFIYYYYWDEFAIGKKGKFEGGLRVVTLDPLNVVVSDPQEKDIQKQEWIIIRNREHVERVREMCEDEEKKPFINAETHSDMYYSNYTEMDNNDLVDVYTRFFRIENEVYFEKSTKSVLLHKPIPLNPEKIEREFIADKEKQKERAKNEGIIDGEDKIIIDASIPSTQDSNYEADERKEYSESEYYRATLYPVEMNSLIPRNNSIYGISEVETCIESQKIVNFVIALATLNCQQMGMPRLVVKNGALKNQQVTNKIGEVLTDYTPGGIQGIYAIPGQALTEGGLNLAPTIFDFLRTVKNASEVITGEMITKDLSGTAIAQLQAQSQKPIMMYQKRFWRSKERCGKIMEQFYKLYYENKKFSYEYDYSEKQNLTEQIPEGIAITSGIDIFNGKEHQDTSFAIVVEAGAGTQYSEIQSMNMLNNLLQNGLIDLNTYTEMYPESAMPFKAEMKEYLHRKEISENSVLKQQNSQMQQQLAEISQYVKQQEQAINDLLTKVEKTSKEKDNLKAQYVERIKAGQQIVNSLVQELNKKSGGQQTTQKEQQKPTGKNTTIMTV